MPNHSGGLEPDENDRLDDFLSQYELNLHRLAKADPAFNVARHRLLKVRWWKRDVGNVTDTADVGPWVESPAIVLSRMGDR